MRSQQADVLMVTGSIRKNMATCTRADFIVRFHVKLRRIEDKICERPLSHVRGFDRFTKRRSRRRRRHVLAVRLCPGSISALRPTPGISLKYLSVSELKFCMEGGNVWKF